MQVSADVHGGGGGACLHGHKNISVFWDYFGTAEWESLPQ